MMRVEDKWHLYYEIWSDAEQPKGFKMAESDDLAIWRTLDRSEFSLPAGARHGTFFDISEGELQALLNPYLRS